MLANEKILSYNQGINKTGPVLYFNCNFFVLWQNCFYGHLIGQSHKEKNIVSVHGCVTNRMMTVIMENFKWGKEILAVFLLFVLSGCLHAATGQKIESALESARKDLYISIASEKKIISEIEKLKKSGNASDDTIKDYELYLSRVQALVAEKRKVVEKIKALYTKYDIQKEPGGSDKRDRMSMVDLELPEEKVVDKVAELDRQLDRSLSEFDEMLLREVDLVRAKSSEKMRDLAQEAEAAAKRLRDKGIDIDTYGEKGSVESGETSSEEHKEAKKGEQGAVKADKTSSADHQGAQKGKDSSKIGGKNKSEKGKDGTAVTGQSQTREGSKGSGPHPGSQYDSEDDDIVAKQLREAAEGETDPELKEKLWKEYEKYRENSGS